MMSLSVDNYQLKIAQKLRSNGFNTKFGHQSELALSLVGLGSGPKTSKRGQQTQTLLEKSPKPETTQRSFGKLCCNGVFMLLILAISCLYFVVSGLQFWVTVYVNTVLGVPIQEVYLFFAITCLTGPLAGVLISILVFNCVGGYQSSRALDLVCLFGFLACLVSIPAPFTSNKTLFYSLIWLVFFFGSMIVAPLVGIMLNTVAPKRRTVANSMATLAYNLFGFLPAPFIFGLFSDMYPKNKEYSMRLAIAIILYWSIVCAILTITAYVLILKRRNSALKGHIIDSQISSQLKESQPSPGGSLRKFSEDSDATFDDYNPRGLDRVAI